MKGLKVIRSKWPINFISLTELSYLKQATPRSTLSLAKARRRRRRRRISITAGWAAEGSEACGSKNDGKIVLEEGKHMEYLHSLFVFALFEDVMLSCCETAGYVRFALFTSGYGYSPPSATLWQAIKSSAAMLAWDDNRLKMCLLCTCESLIRNKKARKQEIKRKQENNK